MQLIQNKVRKVEQKNTLNKTENKQKKTNGKVTSNIH